MEFFLYKKRNYTLTLMCISHSNEDHNGLKLININIKEKLNIFECLMSVLGLKNGYKHVLTTCC